MKKSQQIIHKNGILPTCVPLTDSQNRMLNERQTNNFDFLRLLAASLVVVGHASTVLYNKPFEWDITGILTGISMPKTGVMIFFVISGYLVTGSSERRKSIVDFFLARVFRIFPAVIVLILLTVFILGPLVTTYSYSEYFSSETTWRYLQNMSLFRMYYHLPGVFENNVYPGSVNASLWTLPYEFTCYLFIAALSVIYLLRNKWAVLVIFLFCFTAFLLFREENNKIVIPVLGIDFKNFTILFLYFMSGSVYYLFRKNIPLNIYGLLLSLLFCLAMRQGVVKQEFYVFVLPYIVLWIAFTRHIPFQRAGRWGDFSYGLFLYSFPVQQTLLHFFPATFNLPVFILLSFICTLPIAVMSWYFVEKPALGWRKFFNVSRDQTHPAG